ncbi:dnaJ-like protein 60 [Leptidea sinapis]|uniref:J domain-containing protein n=1 Tax=Leptidea sinapis TaxID=189913 RepID=A0A5E4Q232_9NEOP|nr:dnaJ-like protein 60 [Leptidea sinapis]VVC92357.1 unnamed protein product [Leptidea sinapis]
MYFHKRSVAFKSICSIVRLHSLSRKNHYDVLNLRRNCSDQEIKDAFIKMSKQYHPDKNKDVKAQEKFVQIVEAYNVLGKPSSRSQYDHIITMGQRSSSYYYKTSNQNQYYNQAYTQKTYPDYNFYTPPKDSKNTKTDYYGVKGLKKLPNMAIILLCFSVALIGTILQIIVIREAYVGHRTRTIEQSKMLAKELDKVRENAVGKTNEMQTQAILEKIVRSSNTTVATATLGHSLANEKK